MTVMSPVGPISVVMATHQTAALPAAIAAVESLDHQTLPVDTVIVAVDHNPQLAELIRGALPKVQVVQNDGPNRGASATRNAGALVCDTDVIAFLDDDEIADPEWLARLVPALTGPDVVGTGGRYVPRWERRRPVWFPDELAWAVGAHHSGMPDEPGPVRNVWSGNMAVRTDVFREVGGFREGFGKDGNRLSPEDTDLCVRMAAARPGGHWIYEPEARIGHAVPAGRSSFRFFVRRCFAEGRGKIYLRELHDADGASDVLDPERYYLTRTIPRGVAGHLRDAFAALLRASAILIGIGAAGAGAVVSTAEGPKRRRRNR